jgi:hypothetical protein
MLDGSKQMWERKNEENKIGKEILKKKERKVRKILTVKRITVGGSVFCIPRRG